MNKSHLGGQLLFVYPIFAMDALMKYIIIKANTHTYYVYAAGCPANKLNRQLIGRAVYVYLIDFPQHTYIHTRSMFALFLLGPTYS